MVMGEVQRYIDIFLGGKVISRDGGPLVGSGLALLGRPGVGKTTLASVIGQTLIRLGSNEMWDSPRGESLDRPVYFTSYPTLLETLKQAMSGESGALALRNAMFVVDRGSAIRLLIIDDLGKEHRTESGWAEKVFEHLLRERFEQGYPTLVTSNTPWESWGGVYGLSLASFAHDALHAIVLDTPNGRDRRLPV